MYDKLLAILWVAGIASAGNRLTLDGKRGVAATIVSTTPNILQTTHVPVTPTSGGAPIVIAYAPAVGTVTSAPPIATVTAVPIATKIVGATYTAPGTNSIVLPETKTYSPPIVADPVGTKSAPSFSYQSFTTHSVSGPVVAQRLNAPTVTNNHAAASPSVTRAYLPPVTQDKETPHVTVYVVEPARVKSVAPAYSYQNFYQVIPAKKTVVTPIVAAKTVSAPLVSTYAAPVVSAPEAVAGKAVTTYTAPATPIELTAKIIEAPEATYAAGHGVATYSASAPARVQYISTVPVRYAAAAPVQYDSYAVSASALETPVVASYTADPAETYTADPVTCITAPGITYAAPLSGASYVSDPGVSYSAGHTRLSYSSIPGVTYSVIPAGYNTAPATSAYASIPELTYANVPWTLNAAAPAYRYVKYGADYPFKKK